MKLIIVRLFPIFNRIKSRHQSILMESHKDQDSEFDVVLVYPRKRVTYSKAMLPLGILSIAAVLEHAGFRVKVLDMNIYKGGFSEDLVRWNPKIIGFGGTTPTRKAVYRYNVLFAQQVLCIKGEFDFVQWIISRMS